MQRKEINAISSTDLWKALKSIKKDGISGVPGVGYISGKRTVYDPMGILTGIFLTKREIIDELKRRGEY